MVCRINLLVWISVLISSAGLAAKLPPLPTWSEADKVKLKEGSLVVGVGLLTNENPKKVEEKAQAAEVIIEAVAEKPSLDTHQSLEENSEISGVHLEHYFAKRPTENLVDPQQLLSMQERADLKYALQLHSEESDLPIYVYLFDKEQKLPENYAPKEVYDSVYAGNEEPLVIVYYFIGAPERSEFLLAGGASEKVPQWQVRELLWNAAHKAREKSDVFDQLEGFVGQLSMRLFWIEEILREMVVEVATVADDVTEHIHKTPKSEKLTGMLESAMAQRVPPVTWGILGGGLVVVVAVVLIMRRKLLFPDKPSSTRLGASRGAMSGGVLRYDNPRVPPTSQKEQFDKDFF